MNNYEIPKHQHICVPDAPRSISKGVPLTSLLDSRAISYLARNLSLVYPGLATVDFIDACHNGLESLSLMQRAQHIAQQLVKFLPQPYAKALPVLLASLPDRLPDSEEFGLAGFFFLPYSSFIARYGVLAKHNGGEDPFALSMHAQIELTQRFTAEFCIRPFLNHDLDRTLAFMYQQLEHSSNHVRRWCSEGARPRLPWGQRIAALIADPTPLEPTLQALKNDPSLYVRRSVANCLGDIGKSHPERLFDYCETWLQENPNNNIKWLVRHAVRYYAKRQHPRALAIRQQAR